MGSCGRQDKLWVGEVSDSKRHRIPLGGDETVLLGRAMLKLTCRLFPRATPPSEVRSAEPGAGIALWERAFRNHIILALRPDPPESLEKTQPFQPVRNHPLRQSVISGFIVGRRDQAFAFVVGGAPEDGAGMRFHRIGHQQVVE